MAKKKVAKKDGPNKAQAIRDYLSKHPEARGVEVVEALGKAGIVVQAAQVSNIKTSMSGGGKKKAGPKKKATGKASTNGHAVSISPSAVAFVESVGGLEAAEAQLAALWKLKGVL